MKSSIFLQICGIIQLSCAEYYYNQGGQGYSYPKPQNPLILPTTTAPGYVYQKPSIPFTIPPKQSIPENIFIGYQYPKPQIPFELPKPTSKNTFTIVDQKKGYQYLKPQNPLIIRTPEPKEVDSYRPKIQYQYTKPQIPLEFIRPVTNVDYQYPKPPKSSSTLPLKKPKENVIINRPKNSIGYQYPKPVNPLTIPPPNFSPIPTRPTMISTQSVPITIPSNPIILPPKQPSSKRGYYYPKPAIPFNIPSRPATVVKEKVFSGYQYPKPIIPFEPVPMNDISEGYSYPKPSIPFSS